MAGFKFDEVDSIIAENSNKINFLKLQDDGWYANVRFMYGSGEIFGDILDVQTVHNISDDPTKPRYVPCLRKVHDPLEVCPLCQAGSKVAIQFFIPIYVHSIVSNLRGVQNEQPVEQVMIVQKGSSFKGALQSVVRYTQGTNKPIVSSVFRLVRNGKAKDPRTGYSVEYVRTDDTTLEQLPERPQILGSYILPNLDYQTMLDKYVNKKQETPNVTITPRTLNANTFSGNTVIQAPGINQVSAQAPIINGNGNVPF